MRRAGACVYNRSGFAVGFDSRASPDQKEVEMRFVPKRYSMTLIEKKLRDASNCTASMLVAELVYAVELYAVAFNELREAIGLIKAERRRINDRYEEGGITYEVFNLQVQRNFELLCWAADCQKAADDLMYEHFSTLAGDSSD